MTFELTLLTVLITEKSKAEKNILAYKLYNTIYFYSTAYSYETGVNGLKRSFLWTYYPASNQANCLVSLLFPATQMQSNFRHDAHEPIIMNSVIIIVIREVKQEGKLWLVTASIYESMIIMSKRDTTRKVKKILCSLILASVSEQLNIDITNNLICSIHKMKFAFKFWVSSELFFKSDKCSELRVKY